MRLSVTPFTALRSVAAPAQALPAFNRRAASTSTVSSADAVAGISPELAASATPTESIGEIRLKAIKLYKEVSCSAESDTLKPPS
jgi:hypothetical protein